MNIKGLEGMPAVRPSLKRKQVRRHGRRGTGLRTDMSSQPVGQIVNLVKLQVFEHAHHDTGRERITSPDSIDNADPNAGMDVCSARRHQHTPLASPRQGHQP